MIVKCEYCGKDIDGIEDDEAEENELFFHSECFDQYIYRQQEIENEDNK